MSEEAFPSTAVLVQRGAGQLWRFRSFSSKKVPLGGKLWVYAGCLHSFFHIALSFRISIISDVFQDFPINHVNQGPSSLAVGLVGLHEPLQPILPQTLSPFMWPEPTPRNPRKCAAWKTPACRKRLELKGNHTAQCRTGHFLQPSGAPQPCLPDWGGCLCGTRILPTRPAVLTPPWQPLFSVAGETIQPELPPHPVLGAPLLWEASTRKFLPRVFLPSCFSLFLVKGQSPPLSHTN